jgi:hypothetical protein
LDIKKPIKALKAMIKEGSPEKVIKFANYCRTPDAYILAGNFL